MATEDFDSPEVLLQLEKQELDAPNGIPPTRVYLQLLSIYLLKNELAQAKFLWKRIPGNVKSVTPELALIWGVGKCLWQRDLPGVYAALNQNWSPVVKDIMRLLLERVRERAANLVAKAYTSIRLEDFSCLVGLVPEEALKCASNLGWEYESATRMVLPVKPPPKQQPPISSEDQLTRLAKYISFLEN